MGQIYGQEFKREIQKRMTLAAPQIDEIQHLVKQIAGEEVKFEI